MGVEPWWEATKSYRCGLPERRHDDSIGTSTGRAGAPDLSDSLRQTFSWEIHVMAATTADEGRAGARDWPLIPQSRG